MFELYGEALACLVKNLLINTTMSTRITKFNIARRRPSSACHPGAFYKKTGRHTVCLLHVGGGRGGGGTDRAPAAHRLRLIMVCDADADRPAAGPAAAGLVRDRALARAAGQKGASGRSAQHPRNVAQAARERAGQDTRGTRAGGSSGFHQQARRPAGVPHPLRIRDHPHHPTRLPALTPSLSAGSASDSTYHRQCQYTHRLVLPRTASYCLVVHHCWCLYRHGSSSGFCYDWSCPFSGPASCSGSPSLLTRHLHEASASTPTSTPTRRYPRRCRLCQYYCHRILFFVGRPSFLLSHRPARFCCISTGSGCRPSPVFVLTLHPRSARPISLASFQTR